MSLAHQPFIVIHFQP